MMAMITDTSSSLFAARNYLLPAVQAMSEVAAKQGIPIKSADVALDFLTDGIDLAVVYRLTSRSDMLRGDSAQVSEMVADRLNAAMRLFHRTPQAKAVCVDRRRLLWRGEQAAKKAPRPTRKATRKSA